MVGIYLGSEVSVYSPSVPLLWTYAKTDRVVGKPVVEQNCSLHAGQKSKKKKTKSINYVFQKCVLVTYFSQL